MDNLAIKLEILRIIAPLCQHLTLGEMVALGEDVFQWVMASTAEAK